MSTASLTGMPGLSKRNSPRNWQLRVLKTLYRLFPFPLQGEWCLDRSSACLPLSVVLPTYDRSEGQRPFAPLETCLASLAEQEISPESFEIILVEDPLSQETFETIKAFEADLPIRHIPAGEAHRSLGSLRNLGLEHARGHWILIMDDDAFLAPDFLGAFFRIKGGFDPEWDIILPRGMARYSLLNPRYDFLQEYQLATQCIIYPRALLERIRGFHSVNACEDIDLALRAYLAGGQIRKAEQLRYFHPPSHFLVRDATARQRGQRNSQAYRHLKRVYSTPVWVAFVMRDVVELRHLLLPSTAGKRSFAALALHNLRALLTPSRKLP